MVKVTTLKQHQYGSLDRKKGEVYEMEEIHVRMFRLMGNIEPVAESEQPKPEPQKTGRYKQRDVRARR